METKVTRSASSQMMELDKHVANMCDTCSPGERERLFIIYQDAAHILCSFRQAGSRETCSH